MLDHVELIAVLKVEVEVLVEQVQLQFVGLPRNAYLLFLLRLWISDHLELLLLELGNRLGLELDFIILSTDHDVDLVILEASVLELPIRSENLMVAALSESP